jgi:hypothetical protein
LVKLKPQKRIISFSVILLLIIPTSAAFGSTPSLPVVTSLSPASGTASGGTTVTISGSGFTGATEVLFGGIAGTSLAIVNDTQLTVITPVRADTTRTVGAVPVIVKSADGDSNTDKTFTFRPNITYSGNGGIVQLGELASRSQSNSVVRTTATSPYTTSGTDSRSGQPYSFTTTFNYGNSGAFAYESDDRSSTSGTSISTTRTTGTAQSRDNVLTLYSSGNCATNPSGSVSRNTKDGHSTYCSVFGPEVFSEAFYATSAQSISFDWKAAGGGDHYEIYAFLISLSDLADSTYASSDHTIVAHSVGATSDWATASASIPSDGYYKFRFVNGTFDYSGGLGIGANLYVQNEVTVGLSNVISFDNPGGQIGASGTFNFNVSASSAAAVTMTSSTSSVCDVATGSLSGGQTPVTVTKKQLALVL